VTRSAFWEPLDKGKDQQINKEPLSQEAFHVQHSLPLSTHRRPSRKWSVARIEAVVTWSILLPRGAALHTITAAAGVIYRAAIWMKVDDSGPVERKASRRRSDGLIVRIGMRVALARNEPTRSFDSLRATGCLAGEVHQARNGCSYRRRGRLLLGNQQGSE
jgi:hypothetical protein